MPFLAALPSRQETIVGTDGHPAKTKRGGGGGTGPIEQQEGRVTIDINGRRHLAPHTYGCDSYEWPMYVNHAGVAEFVQPTNFDITANSLGVEPTARSPIPVSRKRRKWIIHHRFEPRQYADYLPRMLLQRLPVQRGLSQQPVIQGGRPNQIANFTRSNPFSDSTQRLS